MKDKEVTRLKDKSKELLIVDGVIEINYVSSNSTNPYVRIKELIVLPNLAEALINSLKKCKKSVFELQSAWILKSQVREAIKGIESKDRDEDDFVDGYRFARELEKELKIWNGKKEHPKKQNTQAYSKELNALSDDKCLIIHLLIMLIGGWVTDGIKELREIIK